MKTSRNHIILSIFHSSQKGAAAAEFVMVLPIIIIIFVIIFDFGRLMLDYQTASKSIRDATGYLSRVTITCAGGVGIIDDAQNATIARNLALSGTINAPGAGDYLISYWTDPNSISITITCLNNGGQFSGLYGGIDEIPNLTVSAVIPFTLFFGTIGYDQTQISFSTSTNMTSLGE